MSRAQVNLGFCTITSPVDGIIGEIPVTEGIQVSPGTHLTIVSGNTMMEAREQAVKANLISAVAQQYCMLQLLDRQLEILLFTDSLWNASLETQRALWDNGKAYSIAVNQMESSYLNVKTQIVDVFLFSKEVFFYFLINFLLVTCPSVDILMKNTPAGSSERLRAVLVAFGSTVIILSPNTL